MSLSYSIAVYVLIWWIVLFTVLPLGVRTQGEEGAIVPGTPGSAPAQPRLLRIVLLTTVLSSAIFALIWAAFRFGLVDFDALMGWGR